MAKMKNIWAWILMMVPAVVALIGGWYLIGAEATQMILGWILVIIGGLGVIGGVLGLLKK